jgi:putative phage-type endonuclease
MLQRKAFNSRDEWLAGRTNGIGASEAAAAIGMSPFETQYDLWLRKTGQKQSKDLSGNAAVEYGNRLEPAMRTMFQAEHPEFELDYHQYDVLYQDERPWATATLDGELMDEHGAKYVLEIKTAQVGKTVQWEKWKDRVPENYYIQVLWQLLVTGWDGAYLYAKLVKLNGDSELRTYYFSAEEHKEDMAWLLKEAETFWERYIVTRTAPPTTLPSL